MNNRGTTARPSQEPQSNMPRERLLRLGADGLSNAELLAILLRTGYHGTPVTEMAESILRHFHGDLRLLCDATVEELCVLPGMGRTKSLELSAAFALAQRLARQKLEERPLLASPRHVAQMMWGVFANVQQEEFHVLLVDTQMRLQRDVLVTVGLVNRSLVHPREVFRPAIRESSTAVLLCHNHPSGHAEPSSNDQEVTDTLVLAGEIIGIRVLDHIVVGGMNDDGRVNYFSFKENGRLDKGIKGRLDSRAVQAKN
ncbi:MAG: DNA repair protein RadC [Victivallales bacterium]|nr:DNA repair protein RadC [Victivallales bacterium]